MDNENGFPRMLVQDKEELEKYWSITVLSATNPSVVVPIGLEFQISEPSWASFTFHGTFYVLDTLFFWLWLTLTYFHVIQLEQEDMISIKEIIALQKHELPA